MTVDELRATLEYTAPPDGLPPLVAAMWHLARGDWTRAHEIAQDDPSVDAAWVHAHLHRVEGDMANAGYWYRRAAHPVPADGLDSEWRAITEALLANT